MGDSRGYGSRLDPAEVRARSREIDRAWLSVADDVETVQTADFLACRRPSHLVSPRASRVQVWIRSARPLVDLRPAIDDVVRSWGEQRAQWRVPGDGGPASATDRWLRSIDAQPVLTEAVLARALDDPDVDAWLSREPAAGVTTTVIADRESFDALVDVETAGWGRAAPSPRIVSREWDDLRADRTASMGSASVESALLGRADGAPASVARLRMFTSVVRLYGAVTLPDHRGRGLYSALLRHRCRLGRERGATLALTKGRIDTSAPVLEHAGFQRVGVERSWLVPAATSDSP